MRTNVVVTDRATRAVRLDVLYDVNDGALSQPTRVDWGDGTSGTVAASADGTQTTTHTFAKDGVYKVVCRGNTVYTEQVVSLATFPTARDTHKVDVARERDLKQATATGRLG